MCSPEKTKAQRFLAKPLKVWVGRVGIEPTTNGLRVRVGAYVISMHHQMLTASAHLRLRRHGTSAGSASLPRLCSAAFAINVSRRDTAWPYDRRRATQLHRPTARLCLDREYSRVRCSRALAV